MYRFQTDAYAVTLDVDVLSCTQEGDQGYQVRLSDSLFYPEGGGQPGDHGTIAGQTLRALRMTDDGELLHEVDGSVSGRVELRLDWARRYDFMQQHSAEHLLAATGAELGLGIIAFHLGDEMCDVEFDVPQIDASRLARLEALVNDRIRDQRAIDVRLIERSRVDELEVRYRRLREGADGQIRLVEIDGVDRNPCGGTHVRNTAELQAIKLLGTEKLSRGTRVFFAAGSRVLLRAEQQRLRESELTPLLSCGPEGYVDGVRRLKESLRSMEQRRRRLAADLAEALGRELAQGGGVSASDPDAVRLRLLHRDEADMSFLQALARAAQGLRPELRALLTAGAGGEGLFLLLGPADWVRAHSSAVSELLGGRGGGPPGVFQGKATRLDRRAEAAALFGQTP